MTFLGAEIVEETSYRVHDLLLDFARKKLQAKGTLTHVQRLFVETLRKQCVNGKWNTASTSHQKDYYWKYLPYHIYSSEQESELSQLLFDLHWLQQKAKHTNIPSVVSDFRFLSTPSEEIRLLKSSLMLSGDVIDKNPDYICPQLLGNKINERYLFQSSFAVVLIYVWHLLLFLAIVIHLLSPCLVLSCLTSPFPRNVYFLSFRLLMVQRPSVYLTLIAATLHLVVLVYSTDNHPYFGAEKKTRICQGKILNLTN